MVFCISAISFVMVLRLALKFSKYFLIGFTHYVGKHVQSATVAHSDNKFFHTCVGPFFNQQVQRRNKCFAAL